MQGVNSRPYPPPFRYRTRVFNMKKGYLVIVCLFFLLPFEGRLGWVSAQLNTDRITSIGRNALYFDDYVLSIQYFNQVIKLKPYLSEPYLLRAIAKIQLSDYRGALNDCNAAIERNPFQPGAYYTRGYVWRKLGEAEKAEQDFTQALIYSPGNKTYLIMRADTRSEQKKFEEALDDINYLICREPHSASLLFEKGIICLNQSDTLCARDNFAQSVKYDSQNPANWSALGLINLMLNDEQEALSNLTQSINLGSKWAGDYINRSIIQYHKHNYRSALNDLDKAVQLSPNDAQTYYNRGMLREEVGDYNRALEDFNRAIELEPDKTEMLYQRGTLLLQLRQWQDAFHDFETLIERYPYFLPSYYLAAQAKTALGEKKASWDLRQKAYQLEQKKDSIQSVNTDMQLAQSQPQATDHRKEFSSRAAQNQNDNDAEDGNSPKYTSEARGSVQKRYADVVNEPNMVLTYYAQKQTLRRTNYSYSGVDKINISHSLPSDLYFTTQEIPLTAEMVNLHFQNISILSGYIDHGQDVYYARAMEFALVQDYASAIDDATRALQNLEYKRKVMIEKNEMQDMSTVNQMIAIITFCRANWRFRLLEYQRAAGELTQESTMDFEIMLRDYDYVVSLQKDFSFAYYNKANMLCTQKDYKAAIEHYSLAIEQDQDFAEAYFNRGLTYIYTGDNSKGIADLSKAGELGIYQAYNLITRLQ